MFTTFLLRGRLFFAVYGCARVFTDAKSILPFSSSASRNRIKMHYASKHHINFKMCILCHFNIFISPFHKQLPCDFHPRAEIRRHRQGASRAERWRSWETSIPKTSSLCLPLLGSWNLRNVSLRQAPPSLLLPTKGDDFVNKMKLKSLRKNLHLSQTLVSSRLCARKTSSLQHILFVVMRCMKYADGIVNYTCS